jgi:hypothetical protein
MLIFVNQIAHIVKCEKERIFGWRYYGTNKIQVGTKFFNLIPVYETKTGVFEYCFMSDHIYLGTAEEYNQAHTTTYCDGVKVYKMPHVKITMSSKDTVEKYFKTVAEMDAFVESLDTRETISIN